jgi:hypothetical protein
MSKLSLSLREIDALILEKFWGYRWIQAPQFDANGPLPEQGPVLAPPSLDPNYEWPRIGIINKYFFCFQKFTTDPIASKALREKLAERWDVLEMTCDNRTHGAVRYKAKMEKYQTGVVLKFVRAAAPTEELAWALASLASESIEVEVRSETK